MKNKLILTVLSVFALSGVANAQTTAGGTLGVTANIVGSINLIFSTATNGFAVTGTGSATASLPFGNVSMFGPSAALPAGVTRTLTGTGSFTLSTPINVEVDLANVTSDNYSLLGTLNAADTVNSWTFNSIAVTAAGIVPQVTTGAYGVATPYVFAVTIPTATIGALTNSINFTATAN